MLVGAFRTHVRIGAVRALLEGTVLLAGFALGGRGGHRYVGLRAADRPVGRGVVLADLADATRDMTPPTTGGRCSIARMKGLICAGGTATRLEELTRVTNKHLLPVGRWPMVYYPLQLLQRLGVREVLLVTGQQHAGQFIDLLGDGRRAVALRRRAALRPRSVVQGPGRAGRDRPGRRDGARLRARRAARRLPRRQHLRARAGRGDRLVGATVRSSS